MRFPLTVSLIALLASQASHAQTTGNERVLEQDRPEDGISASRIIVEGTRLRGQLVVEQEPLLELGEEDIASEGVTSIADLVTQVTAQTGSARGRGSGERPVILVNGIRVGSFRELRSYPPEALARVEVFPEEVAQRFGFDPDRRVINLILKENYSSREVEFEFEGPSRGGYLALEQELGYLRIADGGRLNLNFEARDISLLTESERDVIQTPGSTSELASDPDQAEFRSLVADSLTLEANASWAKALIESGTSLSANLNYDRSESRSLSGLNLVELTDPSGASLLRTFGEDDPLERRNSTDTYSASGSLTRPIGDYRLTATADASLTDSETEIDQRFDASDLIAEAAAGLLSIDGVLPTSADAGFDIARQRSWAAESKLTLRGTPFALPAGEVATTLDLELDWNRIESSDTRSLTEAELTRRSLSGGANISIPVAERGGALGAIGDVTFNLNGGVEDLSDFGTLGDWSAGLTWSPFGNLELSATYIVREVAPSLTNLGSAQIVTLNAPVFDFVNGETVLATVTSGGNPDLLAETQTDWKFGLNWRLPFWDRTRFTAEYIRNRSDDVTSDFPVLTEEIEAAFPDRVTRDATGQLIALDQRPVTFAETRADRLQFSLTTRGSWGRASGGGADGPSRRGGRGEGGRPFRGGPPSEEQRAQFRAFRERVCGEGGLEMLTGLVEAVESGEDLSARFPGFDPQRFERILSRVRDENGEITPERLAMFRDRFCSMDPAMMRRPGGRPGGPEGSAQAGGRPEGARGGPPRNPLTSGFGRDGTGRYFVNLTHTVELKNEVLVASGGPLLDLLDGDSTSQFGQARHATRLELGVFRRGLGMRVSGRYTGKARIDGSGLLGSTDLFFDDLATVDIRIFSNIGQLIGKDEGFLKNFRVSLRADNIFDGRRRVTDANGDTPINYQPFVIDPTGRFVGIDLRKLF